MTIDPLSTALRILNAGPSSGLPDVTAADLGDRSYVLELLECARSSRSHALAAAGLAETPPASSTASWPAPSPPSCSSRPAS